nr:unnamed protein product [Callosobruchus chinensis]
MKQVFLYKKRERNLSIHPTFTYYWFSLCTCYNRIIFLSVCYLELEKSITPQDHYIQDDKTGWAIRLEEKIIEFLGGGTISTDVSWVEHYWNGHADKDQIIFMVKQIVKNLNIKCHHTADALATAICHAYTRSSCFIE